MARSNLVARALNDLGAAAWFGGALTGVMVGRSGADEVRPAGNERADQFGPVELAAVGAHLLGGALLTFGNRERVLAQRGVATLSLVRTAVTVAAVAATVSPARLGRRGAAPDRAPVGDTAAPVAGARSRSGAAPTSSSPMEWAVPALTGALIVLNAAQGEQQRPSRTMRGVLRRLSPLT